MFQQNEFESINNELNLKHKDRRKTLKKVWGILLAITILIIVFFIIMFPNQFDKGETAWILPTYGGMVLLTTLTGFLISLSFVSEKPFFEFLFPEIINKINMHEGLFLEYSAYEKQDKEFNKTGGLFTRMASVKIRRRLVGYTEDQLKFKVYDCTMTTSSGKSQQTHFDGTYFILSKSVTSGLQIRTNGSPKLKGVKFEKQGNMDLYKVYKTTGIQMANLDHKYLRFVEILQTKEGYKKIYLSIVEGEIHLAVWYKKHPCRKQKQTNINVVNNLANHFLNEVKILNQLSEIDNY